MRTLPLWQLEERVTTLKAWALLAAVITPGLALWTLAIYAAIRCGLLGAL